MIPVPAMTAPVAETLPILIDRAGYVYAIRNDAARSVKIGFSASPMERLQQLQTASPNALRLLCAIPSFMAYEKSLHGFFASRRMEGEWFDDADGHVASTMIGTADLLARAGLTIADIVPLQEDVPQQLRKSARACLEHADALEAEALASGAA